MTTFSLIACLGVLLAVGYFFYCCAISFGLWLRERVAG